MSDITHAQRTAIKIAMARGERMQTIAAKLGISIEAIRGALPKHKDYRPSLAAQGKFSPHDLGRPMKGRTIARAKRIVRS